MFPLPAVLLMLYAVDPAGRLPAPVQTKSAAEKIAAAAPAQPNLLPANVPDTPQSAASRSPEPRTTRLDRLENERAVSRPR